MIIITCFTKELSSVFFVPSTSTVDFVHPSLRHDRYSVSTNFRLELIELSARDFFCHLVERDGRAAIEDKEK